MIAAEVEFAVVSLKIPMIILLISANLHLRRESALAVTISLELPLHKILIIITSRGCSFLTTGGANVTFLRAEEGEPLAHTHLLWRPVAP